MAYIGKSPTGSGVRQRYVYTATGGETSLSGADDNGKTLVFTDGEYVDVYLNGVLLVQGSDYGVGTTNTISGLTALTAGQVVEIIVYDIYSVAKINSEAIRYRYYKTATGGETSISGTDDSGATITFPANAQIDVYLNGISLVAGTDYNTTTANTVGGLAALSSGDIVEIIYYTKFVLSDTVSKGSGGTFEKSIGVNGNLTIESTANPTINLEDTDNGFTATQLQVQNGGRDFMIDAPQDIIIKQGGSEIARFLSGEGLTFNGDTAAANALDDYEEGTWTPVYEAATTNPTCTYDKQEGFYTKIGRLVTISCRIRTDSASGGSGGLRISGLPFTSNSATGSWGTINVAYTLSFTTAHGISTGYISKNSTYIIPIRYNSDDPRNARSTGLVATDLNTGTNSNDLIFTGTYYTA